jgi:hypothetical protein
MSKAFASQADLEDKKITFEQLSPHCWAYTAEGRPQLRRHHRRRLHHGQRRHRHAGHGARPDQEDPHRQRQAHQVRAAHALPRGARAGRQRLFRRGRDRDHRQPRHAGADPRARRAGHEERDGALPAPVPRRRLRAGPDLAEHGHRRRRRDQGRSAGQAVDQPRRHRGADLEPRVRPHARRHHRLGGSRKGAVQRRPGRVRGGRLHRRRPAAKSGLPRWKPCAP